MIVDDLKNSILNSAFSGKLVDNLYKNNVKILEELNDIKSYKNILIAKGDIPKDNKFSKINNDNEFIVPEGWCLVRIQDIAIVVTDYVANGSFKTLKENTKRDPINKYAVFVRTLDLSNDFKNSLEYVDENSYNYLNKSRLFGGELILPNIGGSIGKTFIMPNVANHMTLAPNSILLKFKNDVTKKYVKYYFESSYGKNQLLTNKGGTATPKFSKTDLRQVIIPLPPIDEQQRIVDKIEELFQKLDEIKTIEEELSTLKLQFPIIMRKSIIDYAIKGKITHSIENVCLEEIIDSNLYRENEKKFKLNLNKDDFPFEIPENWIWTKIGNLFSYKNGYAYKPFETSKIISDYPIIKSQNLMTLNVIVDSNTSYVENPNEKMLASKVNNGDFLMCLSSQSSNTEPLGKTAIYNLKYNALLNQRVLKLTPFNSIYSKFLFYVINSQYFHYTVSHKGGGSAQSNLKLEHVMEMYVPFPPIEEQNRIVEKLDILLPLCDDIEKMVKELS
jgi:restriction endonuclease S subunit